MAKIEFSTKVRGYDKAEVDAYIKKLHTEYAEICAHLQAKIVKMEESIGEQENIAKAMIRAEAIMQRAEEEEKEKAEKFASESKIMADQVIGDAKSNANKILDAARDKVEELLTAAEAKANSITIMAEIQAERIKEQIYQSRVEMRENMLNIYNISSLFLKEMDKDIKSEGIIYEFRDRGISAEKYAAGEEEARGADEAQYIQA